MMAHVGLLLLASWLSCVGGWRFGGGRLRNGLLLGLLGIATFLVDHWVFD
jgi:hypothetical protein